jgi:hypothetical protein
MIKLLTPALVLFPLLGAVGTSDPLGILKSQGEIMKVAEGCGIGFFRDGYGHCRYYGYGAPAAPPGEACPPDRHFVPWINHSGGRCVVNG